MSGCFPWLAVFAVEDSQTGSFQDLLVPLLPKIDLSQQNTPIVTSTSNQKISPQKPLQNTQDTNVSNTPPQSTLVNTAQVQPKTSVINSSLTGKTSDNADLAIIEDKLTKLEPVSDNTILKGTIQIVADDTEFNQNNNTFLGTGNAVAVIAGQDARLEADTILYDQNAQVMDARGNVRIIRQGQLSTGSAFKFKVNSDEYLITQPNTEVQGAEVMARVGYGRNGNSGIAFQQGSILFSQPIHLTNNPYAGTITSSEATYQKNIHPDAYLPVKASYIFKARKMVYERYKEEGNLTVFGGRLVFGSFSIPIGNFTATSGKVSRVTFPVTLYAGNNIQVGGVNIGPMFNTAVGKMGIFSWAPLLQYGGRTTSNVNSSNIGVGIRVRYSGLRLSGNLAYGSVSNILVGDVRYIIDRHTIFQLGINRFLPDGLFGQNRARERAEVVNNKGVGGIPFLTGINFRSSAGWMQDQPSLLNLTPQYQKLFTATNGNISSGFRLQEQIMTSTQPLFQVGNRKYGAQLRLFGGAALRAYDSGDKMLMGEVGPTANVYLDRLRLQGALLGSAVRGSSPFVFDEFIQGNRSAQVGGDFKVCKWFTVGCNLGYNIDAKLLYQRSLCAAVGPEDFKFLVTLDTITGADRYGFDMLYGQPIPFNKLVLKDRADSGQLGGM